MEENVSAEGKDLLRNILEVDSEKRFRMDEIDSHEWF